MSDERHFLVVGLPGAGKTTYLAAFWHVAESGELPESMRLAQVTGDREHLHEIRSLWLQCKPPVRTVTTAEKTISMLLVRQSPHPPLTVCFPDMSGESFRQHWCERSWTAGYDKLVGRTSGVLLFVHPDNLTEPHRIDAVEPVMQELPADQRAAPAPVDKDPDLPWDVGESPTQVILVDTLQSIMERAEQTNLRTAIVVSAWDLVDPENLEPDQWLARRLPLLQQFLESNQPTVTHRVFGISAQGGDFETDGERLLRIGEPSRRIRVRVDGVESNDITEPLRWLIA